MSNAFDQTTDIFEEWEINSKFQTQLIVTTEPYQSYVILPTHLLLIDN